MANIVEKTTKTLGEEPIWVLVGLLPIKVRPITLYQMWEISSVLENVEIPEINENGNAITEAMKYKDMYKIVFRVVLSILFRSKWKRSLFGRYLQKRFTMSQYRAVMTFGFESFNAAFFLGSFIFLKGAKETAKETRTAGAIHLGDLSEE